MDMNTTNGHEDGAPTYIKTLVDQDGQVVRRQGHLLSLMGFTQQQRSSRDERYIDTKFMDITVSAFLAWKDLEERRGHILPHLPSLLQGCNFHWTLEIRDPQFSRAQAVRQALAATLLHRRYHQDQQHPFAVVGPLFSSVTETANALLAGGMGVAQISGEANSAALNGAPLFSRTVPNSHVQAQAMTAYLKRQNITRVANLYYVDDTFGIEFNADLQEMAKQHDIKVLRFAMQRHKTLETLRKLKASDVRYVVAVLEDTDYKDVARIAYRQDVMGHPDYAWFLLGFSDMAHRQFAVPTNDPDLAKALHGVGVVHLHLDQHTAFNVALHQFANSKPLQQSMISRIKTGNTNDESSSHAQAMFQNYTFGTTNLLQQFQYYTYDAVIALGLAACQTPGNFTGQQLHESLLQLEFQGVSGLVSFDPTTGTRSSNSTMIHVTNILLSEKRSTAAQFQYESHLVATITGDQVTQQSSLFVYSSNSTIAPQVFPTMTNHNYNLIPLGLQILGLVLGAIVILLSTVFFAWTVRNRNKFVVTCSQPIFLLQLCSGTIVMALAIVPLSFQGEESSPRLNMACMSVPWLFFLGFATAIAAILSKTWRLEQIMNGATTFRRVTVEPLDVAKPFAILIIWNATMLTAWTILAPIEYERISVNNYDMFGRNIESYGACRSTHQELSWLFSALIMAADVLIVLFTCHKCYKVRHKSTYYVDTSSLGWSAASLLETAIVFGPFLIAARDNPSADFMATSSVIVITCLSFLLPIFLPKVYRQNAQYGDAQQDERNKKDLAHWLATMQEEGGGCDLESVSSRRGRMTIVRLDSGADGVSSGASLGSESYRSQKSQRHQKKVVMGPTFMREWTPQAA
ncbi:Gamma-aminobutyric acid (GABA) B receptor [Seminavis robusta]|uniref:Gamma-aminobutyric acid (GABA) B receptor n=1 Tax=Seminavis robusta TaxID=568900 RepID=A0A9N8DND6_9STRA|nr:Gamma-aminobutyric acid (GABA) B receptor [Seminavis robusta]|eukprot:Sro257_g100950.1 Gamma-aminobutyric acid (GABA) B receptor (858) ;mRNA; f:69429-72184